MLYRTRVVLAMHLVVFLMKHATHQGDGSWCFGTTFLIVFGAMPRLRAKQWQPDKADRLS